MNATVAMAEHDNPGVLDRPAHDPDYLDRLIDEEAAAAFLGVSVRFMQNRRVRGGGPPFVRISGRCIRYRRRELIAWANENLAAHTSAASVATPQPRPAGETVSEASGAGAPDKAQEQPAAAPPPQAVPARASSSPPPEETPPARPRRRIGMFQS